MPSHRPPKSPAEADRRRAVAASRTALNDPQQLILDTEAAPAAPPARPPVILQLDLHDFAVLAWTRDEAGVPVYRIVKQGIKAAKIAATLARKILKEKS